MKDVITTVRLNTQSFRQLKDFAQREDRSVSWVVRRAVEDFVRQTKKRARQPVSGRA